MTWEAVGAMGSILSASVIALTGFFAYRQLRALRTAAQLQGFLELQTQLNSPEMNEVRSFVNLQLPELLKNEQFREELATGKIDRQRHREVSLGNFMESVGMLIFYGVLDERLFLETYVYIAPRSWEQLRPVSALLRQKSPLLWQHFEYFAGRCAAENLSSLNKMPYFSAEEESP